MLAGGRLNATANRSRPIAAAGCSRLIAAAAFGDFRRRVTQD
jgi:hypothetical protein